MIDCSTRSWEEKKRWKKDKQRDHCIRLGAIRKEKSEIKDKLTIHGAINPLYPRVVIQEADLSVSSTLMNHQNVGGVGSGCVTFCKSHNLNGSHLNKTQHYFFFQLLLFLYISIDNSINSWTFYLLDSSSKCNSK